MRDTRDVLYAYLFGMILGGVMLGASLIGGGHHGLDHDAGGDGGDGDVAGGHDASAGETNEAVAFALRMVSIRALTYLLAFGGVTGLLLRTVAHTSEPLTALVSLAVGAVAGAFAQTLFRRAARSGAGGTVTNADLVGRSGDVVVPFARGQTGKVRVHVKGSDVDLLAITDDSRPIEAREEVLVVEMREGSALVTRNPTR